jgi:hypothetical protein
VLSALATARTTSLLHGGDSLTQASTHGYQRALLVGACVVLAATVVALLTPNTHHTTTVVEEDPEDAALELAA